MNFFYKISIIVLLFFSCAVKPHPDINVEINCPHLGRKVIVENVDVGDVLWAIDKNIEKRRRDGTNENYAVLRFKDRAATYVKKIPPEEMLKCIIRRVPHQEEINYVIPS